jgi:hypothetical protein
VLFAIFAKYMDTPGGGANVVKDKANGRGFTRAVWAQEAEYLAFFDVDTDIVDRGLFAKLLAKAGDLDGVLHTLFYSF